MIVVVLKVRQRRRCGYFSVAAAAGSGVAGVAMFLLGELWKHLSLK